MLSCGNSGVVVFVFIQAFLALCIYGVRIRIYYILIMTFFDIFLKIVFKLWLPQLQSKQARREISANRSKYEHPTFSLIVLLFSVLSMYRPYISARNEVLHFLAWQAIYLEEKLQEYRLL